MVYRKGKRIILATQEFSCRGCALPCEVAALSGTKAANWRSSVLDEALYPATENTTLETSLALKDGALRRNGQHMHPLRIHLAQAGRKV